MEKQELKPAGVFKYFAEICQVPRPSKKEEKIIAYLKAFGEKHNLETKVDEAGNVLIKKPATPGKENLQTVILQSHVDMVCEKNNDVEHDFLVDPIETEIDGEWMKESLSFLCKGRRVFMGKNLYSKGACYAAARKCMKTENSWQFVYMGDNEMKVNVSLKVQRQGKTELLTLINAGDNWYETVGECEVLLDGSNEIDFWLQLPNSKEAQIEKLTLADLPKRPPRTTRLRIKAQPVSDMEVKIKIKDLGFGEIFKSSDKTWEYMMSLGAVK